MIDWDKLGMIDGFDCAVWCDCLIWVDFRKIMKISMIVGVWLYSLIIIIILDRVLVSWDGS